MKPCARSEKMMSFELVQKKALGLRNVWEEWHFQSQHRARHVFRNCRIGAVAGLAGGGAEVLWIALYGSPSTTNAAAVARGVTATFSPELAASALGVASGTAI